MATEADVKARKIELNGETADLLEARADALGISVAELIATIVGNKPVTPPDDGGAPAAGGEPPGARWREVKAWIDSWSKPNELPRPKLGK
jgi:hypothetical protein